MGSSLIGIEFIKSQQKANRNGLFKNISSSSKRLDVICGLKVKQIGHKWDKSVTFSVQISVHFVLERQNVLKFELKKSQICPIWSQSDPLYAQIWLHSLRECVLSVLALISLTINPSLCFSPRNYQSYTSNLSPSCGLLGKD